MKRGTDDTCDYCEREASFYNSGDRTCDDSRCRDAAREGAPKKKRAPDPRDAALGHADCVVCQNGTCRMRPGLCVCGRSGENVELGGSRAPLPAWTLTLNQYQRDNLLWLIGLIGWNEALLGPAAPPFTFAHTGDWVGEIGAMLGADEGRGKPNATAAHIIERIDRWRYSTTAAFDFEKRLRAQLEEATRLDEHWTDAIVRRWKLHETDAENVIAALIHARLVGEVAAVTEAQRPPLTHVACRDTEGRIWSLPRPLRHHHVIRLIDEHGSRQAEDNRENQGFLDASGRYLTRDQALVSAEVNGQIKNGKIIGGVLTSEDLW